MHLYTNTVFDLDSDTDDAPTVTPGVTSFCAALGVNQKSIVVKWSGSAAADIIYPGIPSLSIPDWLLKLHLSEFVGALGHEDREFWPFIYYYSADLRADHIAICKRWTRFVARARTSHENVRFLLFIVETPN